MSSYMNNNKTWVWVAVAAGVIIVGFWWWNMARQQADVPTDVGYASPTASTTDALVSPAQPVVAEVRTSSTVAGIIASLSGESRFAALLSTTGVSASLTGKGPYTVFVPTDASFAQLPTGTINNLNSAQLKRLVQYHIVSGKAIDVNIQKAGNIQALSKDMLNFSVLATDKSARVNSSVAIHAYKASNGIVYVIGSVLLPPLPPQN